MTLCSCVMKERTTIIVGTRVDVCSTLDEFLETVKITLGCCLEEIDDS